VNTRELLPALRSTTMTSFAAPPTHVFRVAIVTGAAQGIGHAVALRLADDGLDVAVNDLPSKSDKLAELVQQIKEKGRKGIAVPGDVSVETDVKGIVETTAKELGSVDIMVANAGIVPLTSFLKSTPEELDRVYAVNIRGTMLCFKYAALEMVKQGTGGRLIGASSGAGKQGMPHMSAYSTSKFAIRGLAQSVAIELAPHNITVNTYAPGAINSGMVYLSTTNSPEELLAIDQQLRQSLPQHVKSAGTDVIASIVSYLCKSEAYFISGQSISVDGALRLS